MLLDNDSMKPIYVQIAEWLEGEILAGNLPEEERIYSQYQLAEIFNVNPATAAKSLSLLAEQDIVYKKRGLGMFVAAKARERVRQNRKEHVLKQMVHDLIQEATRLNVSRQELAALILQGDPQVKEEER